MVHRDSMGIKQQYGAGQVQWMSAGRGIIHEEMWDVKDWEKADAELYQIWVRTENWGPFFFSPSFSPMGPRF